VATFFYLKTKILIKMKNFFKVATLLMAVILFTVSSCKKDEQIIEGCTDSSAMNYQSLATSDDGSCIYAYDVAQGVWNISPECDDIDIPGIGAFSLDTILPETIDVQGEGDNFLSIDINGAEVSAEINNSGNVTVPEQSITFSSLPVPATVSGNGKIESKNSGHITLNFSAELAGFPLFSSSCNITLTK